MAGTVLYRLLQVVGVVALLQCANLAWGATPWGGESWSRARLLYASAGAVSALALIAIGALGIALRREAAARAEMQASLARIEAALRRDVGG
ncbi:MAG: hypothetical protein K2X74_00080 [Acetobacteraceae bacterium]|nr:hypothetical protein [Acetobacteraceae bacterium]